MTRLSNPPTGISESYQILDDSSSSLSYYIPHRYKFAVLAFLGLFSEYILRISFSVVCAFGKNSMPSELGWSTPQQSLALSAFFWGYVSSQYIGALLARRFGDPTKGLELIYKYLRYFLGGANIFGIGIFVSAVASLLIPLVVGKAGSNGFMFVCVMRAITGLAQGVTYPCLYHLMNLWIPAKERARSVGSICSGGFNDS